MNKVTFLSFLILSALSVSVLAQPKIELIETTYDFGQVKEEDGPILHEFEFENVGDAPLIISHVKASCGCTTPNWTKDPVAPGERGYVRAQYNPMNRPGSFSKSLRINTNGQPPVVYAYIKGSVIPRVRTIEEKLPTKIGMLRVQSNNINLGRITDEKPVKSQLELYNDSETDTLVFLDKYEGPEFIVVEYDTMVLPPKTKASAWVTYDPSHEDHLGMQSFGLSLFTEEAEDSRKNLNLRASVREYFPPMTDVERSNAAQLSINNKLQNVGKVQAGETVKVEYELVNTGKKNLNIRKVDANCSCLVADLSDYDIKPGKSAKLKVTFDTSNRRGGQNKTVYIYSSDPQNPTQVVTIRASVQN
ncbi:DUF1573 domain-containing protein [Reichenbachiella ulvae]|uniref:DUF1573 domain-containing protein n=1 Tax=Reichenbachiella ulvae TaxID=2980104 RepID=A0ABT3CR46_9BACT|nr:DUF1573 domain-containing protein [Reichenbachiella ulvae]MCV9386142.1 DUF1573 domain-containing protein [Reichenbachiella ulvae]